MTTDVMSTATLSAASPERYAPATETEPRPRSYARQVLADTFSNWRARVSAVWIALLVLGAVFAPFLANSHPLLLKQGGHWSSPLLRHLEATDVILLVGTAVAAIAAACRVGFGRAALLTTWFVALSVPLTLWPSIASGSSLGTRAGFGPALVPLALGVATTLVFGLAVATAAFAVFSERLVGWLPRASVGLGAGALAVLGVFLARKTPLAASLLGLDLWLVLLLPLAFRPPPRIAILAGGAAVALAVLLVVLPVRPPGTIVYSAYREDAKAGLVEWSLNAPIPYSPNDRQRDKPDPRLQPPSREHWFGTDGNGSNVLSRIIHASRIALAVGFISTGLAVLIGVVIGGIMGYFVGRVDLIGMRLIEIFEAIPTLFLLITIVAFFGRNLYLIMAIIGLTGWTGDARFVRAEFLRLRNQDFVHAARAAGLPLRSILFRHMLPNGIAPVLVAASFGVASAILSESVLSFLGLGLVEEPSWGAMLEQARNAGRFVWWLALYPGLAIFLTVFAYNLIGESLRDALDPKLRGIE